MLTRVTRNRAATVAHVFYVDETATDPTGTPTYTVVDANGATIQSGNATADGGGTGRVSFTLASQAALKRCTVTWTATIAGATVVEIDQLEVVGGFFFTLAEGRDSDESLSSTSKYTTADLVARRTSVELECEDICDRAFVPRYDRIVLDGTGTSQIILRHSMPNRSVADIRTLRRIAVATDLDETFSDLSAAEIASVAWSDDGTLTRTDGLVFYEGRRNVVVEFEFGLDAPPVDLVDGSLLRFRSRLNFPHSGIHDRATSYSLGDMGVLRLDTAGAYKTGLPEVDAVYGRHSRRDRDGKPVPVSRPLVYTPQRYSLFHGRR